MTSRKTIAEHDEKCQVSEGPFFLIFFMQSACFSKYGGAWPFYSGFIMRRPLGGPRGPLGFNLDQNCKFKLAAASGRAPGSSGALSEPRAVPDACQPCGHLVPASCPPCGQLVPNSCSARTELVTKLLRNLCPTHAQLKSSLCPTRVQLRCISCPIRCPTRPSSCSTQKQRKRVSLYTHILYTHQTPDRPLQGSYL